MSTNDSHAHNNSLTPDEFLKLSPEDRSQFLTKENPSIGNLPWKNLSPEQKLSMFYESNKRNALKTDDGNNR